jgi:hypothetical protein
MPKEVKMAKWIKLGTIRKSKKGGLYIKVDTDIKLLKDSALQIQDPRKKVKDQVASGKLTEAQGEERLSKIPEYIRQEIFLVTED